MLPEPGTLCYTPGTVNGHSPPIRPSISSAQNPLIKRVRSLLAGAGDLDTMQPRWIIEGAKLVTEALTAGCEIDSVLTIPDHAAHWATRVPKGCCHVITPHLMERISGLPSASPILAIVAPPPQPTLDQFLGQARTLVVLDRVQDPGNVGTIIRSAAGLGADGVLLTPGCAQPSHPKVQRASMGAVFHLPCLSGCSPSSLIDRLHQHGYSRLTTNVTGRPLWSMPFPEKVAFLFGSEGGGLSPNLLTEGDVCLAIPMTRGVESLNVATAVAVCLYERSRPSNRPG